MILRCWRTNWWGVDAAYFDILIRALKAERKRDENFQHNYSYVLNIIDKIF